MICIVDRDGCTADFEGEEWRELIERGIEVEWAVWGRGRRGREEWLRMQV